MNGQHNNNTTYSAADLLRYLNGRMDRGELRALERAMLDDEMLADSVEGFRMMRETLSDEAILARARKISAPAEGKNKKEKETAPVVPVSRFRWLGYAAAACLLLASGWWIFNTTRPENAFTSESDELTNPAYVNADPADSGLAESQNGLADNPKVAVTDKAPKTNDNEDGDPKTTAGKKDMVKLSEEKLNADPVSVSTFPADNPASKNAETRLSESDAKMRKSGAPPAIAGSENHILNFSLIDSSSAIPMAGWDYYREYLDIKLDFPKYDKPVVIDINLNAGGKITGVLVNGPIADKDKAFIIQTIQSGPPWQNKVAKPAKATIQFQ